MMLPLGLPRRSQDGHVQGDRERCARLIRVRVPWWRWSPAWPGRAELFGQPEWPGPPSIVLVDISDKQGVRAITNSGCTGSSSRSAPTKNPDAKPRLSAAYLNIGRPNIICIIGRIRETSLCG